MAISTFKVATGHKDQTTEVSGQVLWFTIGDRKTKFMLHSDFLDVEHVDPKGFNTLSHYLSGFKIGNIRHSKLAHRLITGRTLSSRDAARTLLDNILMTTTAVKVLATFDRAGVLNE
jgi:hypothetical protein